MKKGFWVYWYNPVWQKTGVVEYTTTNEERAIELFYRDFTEDYKVVNIHD